MDKPLPPEEQTSHDFRMTPVGAHLFYICLLPLLVLLSHRNIVAALMLMGLATLFHPGTLGAIRRLGDVSALRRPEPKAVLLWLCILCLYSLISTSWTPVPERWAWSAQIFMLFVISAGAIRFAADIPEKDQLRLAMVLALAVTVSALLVAIEGLSGGWFRDVISPNVKYPGKDIIAVARGTNIAIFLFFPVAAIILKGAAEPFTSLRATWRQVLTAGIAIALMAASLTLTVAANTGALAAGLLAACAALLLPRLTLLVSFAAVAAAMLLVPFVAILLPPVDELVQLEGGPVSWIQRLNIYRYTADFIFSDPRMFLFGGGVNFAWALSEAGTTINLPGHDFALSIMPTHPHNVFLQVWLEFGLAGILMLLAALVQTGRFVMALNPTPAQSAVISGLLAVFMVYALVDMSFWTPWRFAAPALAIYGLVLCWRRIS